MSTAHQSTCVLCDQVPLKTPYKLALSLLASGSKGNAIYISDGETAILIDAGLSGIELERRLAARGIDKETLRAIVVTHEHVDHVRGVGVLSRRLHLPVYINAQTYQAAGQLGNLHQQHDFACGTSFQIGGLRLHPFSIAHDAADPAGFTITANGYKIGLATDLGIATGMAKHHLKDCDLLIIEANHDPDMLIDGPYPWPVKQRIQSRIGHLSNQQSHDLLNELTHPRLKHVFLAHLSETNNHPKIAQKIISPALSGCASKCSVARQDEGSAVVILT
jgi:phosphoribosyl 1,2-cyclic phosphodiesterase